MSCTFATCSNSWGDLVHGLETMLEDVEAGAVVVTPTRRLARQLTYDFDLMQKERGVETWSTPVILPWRRWLADLWTTRQEIGIGEHDQVLSTEGQEIAAWESAISKSGREADFLFDLRGAAELARSAYLLHGDWGIPEDSPGGFVSPEVAAYRRWARAYREIASSAGWVDSVQLAKELTSMANAGTVSLPSRVYWAGFDRLTALQEQWIVLLRRHGVTVDFWRPQKQPERCGVVALPSAEEEIRVAALWAKQRLLDRPQARIGIVVPSLDARRAAVIRTFEEIFSPRRRLLDHDAPEAPFNVSLGESLLDEPVVHFAWSVLQCGEQFVPEETLSAILRSPFLEGAEEERAGRALLARRIRERGMAAMSREDVARWARRGRGESKVAACPVAARLFEAWEAVHRRLPESWAPALWATYYSDVLRAIGWSQEAAHSDRSAQARAAFGEALSEFAGLGAVHSLLAMHDARRSFGRIIANKIFQPKTPQEAPIQILGLLEARGAHFDALWVMGLGDDVWPTAPEPNPFVPLTQQREHSVPESGAPGMLESARIRHERLCSSADEIILSYFTADEDREVRPSPLLFAHDTLSYEDLCVAKHHEYKKVVFQERHLDEVEDDRAGSITEKTNVRGGVAILERQSSCPFRAFAGIRLGARDVGEPGIGVDARRHGEFVHRMLERIWQHLKTSEALAALEESALEELCREASVEAIGDCLDRNGPDLSPTVRELEAQRLTRLALSWLDVESARSMPFEVVSTEERREITFGGLGFRIQVDRIDRFEDGSLMIIDYKTGMSRPNDWIGRRPKSPQLPFYATTSEAEVSGIAFAIVRPPEPAFLSVQRDPEDHDKLLLNRSLNFEAKEKSWAQVMQEWRDELSRLVEEFRRGYAAVDPRNPRVDCEYCDLDPFCRIGESRAQ